MDLYRVLGKNELADLQETLRVEMKEEDTISAMLHSVGRAGLMYENRAEEVQSKEDDIFKEVPVDTRTFFKDFVREDNYPIQQAAVDAVFGFDPRKWDTTYTEFILLWGMGSGKDHLSGKMLAYAAYWLKCLKDSQAYFRLGRGTSIDIANMCINARLAKNVFFEDLCNTVRGTFIPGTSRNWFEYNGVDIRPGKDIRSNEIDFGNGVMVHSLNSETQSDIGMNPLLVVFDEIGGFDVKKAQELYDNTRRTQASRFANTMSHKRLLLSFKRSDNDFMMIRYQESETEEKVYRTKAATWEVNKAVTKEDLAEEYATDPEGARRVYECEGDIQAGGYFRHRGSIGKCFRKKRKNPIIGDYHRIFNLGKLKVKKWFRGKPEKKYYVHVDLATGGEGNDCVGLAMTHHAKMKIGFDAEYINELLKDDIDISRFIGVEHHGVICDLAVQLKARPGKEVQFASIVEFIVMMKTVLHFSIMLVTYDGFHSIGERQRLKTKGIASELLSVDKKPVQYDTLKSLIYSGLYRHYANPIATRELEELIYIPDAQGRYKRRKIGHPNISIRRQREEGDRRGSKDVSDAMAGSTYSCVDNNKSLFSFGFLETEKKGTILDPQEVERRHMLALQQEARIKEHKRVKREILDQKPEAERQYWETLIDSY